MARGGIDAGESADDFTIAVAGLFGKLRLGLGRWIGVEGYRALFDRAIAASQGKHPALIGLNPLGGEKEAGVAAAVDQHGATAVAAGLVALIAALVDLLGRIIGEAMAIQLVEQIGVPSARGIVSTEVSGGSDGQ